MRPPWPRTTRCRHHCTIKSQSVKFKLLNCGVAERAYDFYYC
nr:MAG TPA: hypothetical protein [Caudoviricetes sp.]